MKTYFDKIKNFLKSYFSGMISLTALIVAAITLFIAKASLNVSKSSENISRQMLILSSKDYDPAIQYDITDDSIIVKNLFPDLFSIELIEIGKVNYYGFEDFENHRTIQFPVIHSYWIFQKEILEQCIDEEGNYFITPQMSPLRSFAYPSFGNGKENGICNYFETYYHVNSKKGYALPYLQTAEYLMRISYVDMLGRHRNTFYTQIHCHGRGWAQDVINDSIFTNTLASARQEELDSISDIDSIMTYFIKKYAVDTDKFYGF